MVSFSDSDFEHIKQIQINMASAIIKDILAKEVDTEAPDSPLEHH